MTGESLYPRDLIERLRGRLDEIEKIAARASRRRWDHPSDAPWESARILAERVATTVTRFQALQPTPTEMLRTIQAHRKILDHHAPAEDFRLPVEDSPKHMICAGCSVYCGHDLCVRDWPCESVRLVASIYFPESDG